MLQRFILLLFSVIAICETYAQHPFYYNITDEDGLPSNEVYSIVQDNFGYIWIGCDAGLFRYDGFTFKPYTNSKQNGRSISFLQLDKKGRVWCKNFSGQVYRVAGDSLFIAADFSGKSTAVPQFTLDADCNVYINNINTIEVFNENGDSLKAYTFPERENKIQDITELICYEDKLFFCRRMMGFYLLDLKTERVKQIDCDTLCGELYNRSLFVKRNDELFLIAEIPGNPRAHLSKITQYKTEFVQSFSIEKEGSRIYTIYSDRKNKQWLCSSNGVNPVSEYLKHNSLLPEQKVSNMLHDREGNYWFTTLEHGLFVIPFMEVLRINSLNSGLKEDNFSAITLLEGGKLLAGSYTGELYEFNLSDNSTKPIYNDEQQKFITVKKIRETKDYLLVSRGRICITEKQTGKIVYPSFSNFRDLGLLGDTLFFVMPETTGKIHINDLLGNKSNDYIPLGKAGGRALEVDEQNRSVYFALNEGIFVYNNGKLNELKDGTEKIYANSLSFSEGMLWIASVSKGIYGIQGNKIVNHFTDKNGLTEINMRYVKAHKATVVFCSTDFLYKLDLKTNKLSKFNITSGINPKDINAIELTDSLIVLATNKGLVYFPLYLHALNSVEPNIVITSITHADTIPYVSSSVQLPYNNSNFRIYFSSAAFRSRGNFTYQYRLKGTDTTWVSTPASVNYAVFSSVPPGDFLFEVRAVNENGVMSKTVASIGVSVSSPVWQQWWFYLLVSILSVGIVVLIYQFRIRYLTRKAALQNKLTASQLTALKAQMNPHFMYNALNSIQDLILQSDIKNTNYYLSRFSSLMRKVLDASGNNEITLNDEVEMLQLYLELEKLRFGNDFTYTITVQKGIDRDEIKLPSLILQLFVENAIKHGLLHKKGERKLSIGFLVHNNTLVCSVTDNGVGRARSAEIKHRSVLTHQSFATKATEKRLELINSSRQKKIKLEVMDLMEGEKALGTKVVLEIPL